MHRRPTLRTLPLAATLAATVVLGCSSESDPPPQPSFPCSPTSPSPDDDFARQRDPNSPRVALAEAIAAQFMSTHEPEQLTWDWGEGTFVLSLVDLYRVTGNQRYRDYYQRWIDSYVSVGYRDLLVASDRCPPALAALALYQESCTEAYRTVVTDVLRYLYEQAARTEQGGISHMGTSEIFQPTLWVDSLFMFGNVLTRWGAFADDEQALDEYATQLDIFATLLQDEDGWFRHAYGWELTHEDVYWARGNGWVTAATAEYLQVRLDRGETDERARTVLLDQVDAIVASQDGASGLWWTVLDRPGETYLETSAAALFALGMARAYRAGLLDDGSLPVIESAMSGVESRIETGSDGEPVVTGISGPTTVGTFDDYATIELGDDIDYGVGAVILALIETSGLP